MGNKSAVEYEKVKPEKELEIKSKQIPESEYIIYRDQNNKITQKRSANNRELFSYHKNEKLETIMKRSYGKSRLVQKGSYDHKYWLAEVFSDTGNLILKLDISEHYMPDIKHLYHANSKIVKETTKIYKVHASYQILKYNQDNNLKETTTDGKRFIDQEVTVFDETGKIIEKYTKCKGTISGVYYYANTNEYEIYFNNHLMLEKTKFVPELESLYLATFIGAFILLANSDIPEGPKEEGAN